MLDDTTLAASAVVANSAMNRERQLAGPNSYARELGFDPLDRLLQRLPAQESVAWLDLCCGRGRALLQAGAQVEARGLEDRVELIGVDLVDYFDPATTAVTLICAPATTWDPYRRFDLITVVHGLHYVGDKLGLLQRAASWLTDDGHLIADLDTNSIRRNDGEPLGRGLTTHLKKAGFAYDGRRKRITKTGPTHERLPYDYRGADDRAGPNYTGQPAVHSYYALAGRD
ncbi:methyltransferase [Asanoa ferruginea]|nr:methyltransferase [Asanoa ferruginea]